jgi:haloalkane dehalogenase
MSKTPKTFNYEDIPSKNIAIDGVNIHYIEQGAGDPVVFLHGIPTWSYLWRNILPRLAKYGHCIAPDLVGMGLSDKPDIDYTIFDHIHYMEKFIEQLQLTNITFVLHGWGSLIGFHYAMQHPDKVKGLAFLEGHFHPVFDEQTVALPVRDRARLLESADGGKDVILNSNYYLNKVMPAGVMRTLTDEELAAYQAPFQMPGSTKPIWQYLQDLPIDKKRTKVFDLIETYSKALQESEIPKLLLYALPGFNTSIEDVVWAKENLPNLAVIEIDDALHYAQESHPEEVATALIDWYRTL